VIELKEYKKMKRLFVLFLFLTALAVITSGCSSGKLLVTDVWSRPATSGQNGAVYLVIDNQTGQNDSLQEVRGDIAEFIEVHLSQMDENGAMSMQRQESVSIPSQKTVEFKPGGLHVMLINLKDDLQIDDSFKITLVFQTQGEVILDVPVREP
jgi:copper(I)-binding protein